MDGSLEYTLRVWNGRPKNMGKLSDDFREVHIVNTERVPRIGEAVESSELLVGFVRYRVFDVREEIGSCLSSLDYDGGEEVDISKLNPKRIKVFAYAEAKH